MHILLFIVYSAAFCYFLARMPFCRNSRLKPLVLPLFFGCRVLAGCLHNLVAWKYYPNHGDVWNFFRESFITRHELATDLHVFWADNSTWAYMPHNAIECLHVLFNFFSFDNLYINTLFFDFLVFLGSIALFRAFNSLFGDRLLASLPVLLLPSTLFWTSCIHTEGLLYLFLGFLILYLSRLLREGWRLRYGLASFLFLALTLFFRPATGFALLPALALWILFTKWPARRVEGAPGRLRITVFLAITCLVILVLALPGTSAFLLRIASSRQVEFQQLAGNSRLFLPALEPSWGSVLHVFPVALLNGFFQPLPGSGGQTIYIVFSAELLLIWVLAGYYLAYALGRKTFKHLFTPFHLCCLVLAFLGMLYIGYIIPFAGAIVRYRSIYLPFLVAPFLSLGSSNRIQQAEKRLKQVFLV